MALRKVAFVVVGLLPIVAVECGLFPDVNGLGSSDANVATDASTSEASARCRGDAGPASVVAGTFCIDATEVTNAQYNAFVATNPPLSSLPSTCTAWKTKLTPSVAPPPGSDDYPVVWIDWCDAYAYCAWAGKHLCGRIGGGALAPGGLNDVQQDEWYVACSNGGAVLYPYGATFDAGSCNGPERDAGSVLPSSSMPGCSGGIPGLAQMVGNADEWTNSCASASSGPEAGADLCERRSGSWEDPAGATQTCTFYRTGARQEEDHDIGVRCCSDVAP